MFQTKKEVIAWLSEMEITNYTVLDNLEVNVHDSVKLVKRNILHFPVQFNVVEGHFDCSDNQLATLKGVPYEVKGHFRCNGNQLVNLKYAPNFVQASFFCFGNQLQTLKGAPSICYGNFNVNFNQLTNLEHLPIILGELQCSFNQLKSFKGLRVAKKGLMAKDNPLMELHLDQLEEVDEICCNKKEFLKTISDELLPNIVMIKKSFLDMQIEKNKLEKMLTENELIHKRHKL